MPAVEKELRCRRVMKRVEVRKSNVKDTADMSRGRA